MAILKFPSTGSEQSVAFSANKSRAGATGEGRHTTVFLPIPVAFTIKDGASYSSLELTGVSGATALIAGDHMAGGGSETGINAFGQATALIGANVINTTLLKKIALSKEQLGFMGKKIMSPQTNSNFTGHTIRAFTFSFVLAPSNKGEANEIRKIVDHFRRNLYANSSDAIILDYPTNWKIEFLTGGTADGKGGFRRNKYYPQLWAAYMTGFSSNSNPNANGFYADGSPVEVEITVDFQETRALTQQDIMQLQGDGSGAKDGVFNNKRDGVGDTGLSTSYLAERENPAGAGLAKGLKETFNPVGALDWWFGGKN